MTLRSTAWWIPIVVLSGGMLGFGSGCGSDSRSGDETAGTAALAHGDACSPDYPGECATQSCTDKGGDVGYTCDQPTWGCYLGFRLFEQSGDAQKMLSLMTVHLFAPETQDFFDLTTAAEGLVEFTNLPCETDLEMTITRNGVQVFPTDTYTWTTSSLANRILDVPLTIQHWACNVFWSADGPQSHYDPGDCVLAEQGFPCNGAYCICTGQESWFGADGCPWN